MFKHILYFICIADREIAEEWIMANFEIQDSDTDDACYDSSTGMHLCQFIFYVSPNLTERQQQIIAETLKPHTYLINELWEGSVAVASG